MALTSRQSEEFRGQIEKRRGELLAEIQDDTQRAREAPYGEHAGTAPDTGDASVATLMADLEQADLNRDVGEVRALDAALERMADGRYGECMDCGSDIGLDRLRAFPAALRCIGCQERHEKTFGGQPHSSL
jgi:RNA polymerase-binding protein DksA